MELEFVDSQITAWGGLAILKQLLEKSGFEKVLSETDLPKQGSNRGYSPIQIILQFMASLWCGANRYSHIDVTRYDKTIGNIFNWDKMPEHKVFQRYFNRFDLVTNFRVFGSLYKWFFENISFNNFTLDIDSSVLTRYGEQEGAKKGYNKHKPGRKSQHPIIAFVSDIDMVANFWLRSGDSHTANNFQSFLEQTLSYIGTKKIGLLRLDSGFYDRKIIEYLEQREAPIDYIIAVPMHVNIQRKIVAQRSWLPINKGIEIAEFSHQSQEWTKPRRMIVVRQKIAERPQAVGKQLRLFEDNIEISGYRYTCYITSLNLSAADIWRLYRQRANCENKIKELKYDYGLDKMNQASFDGTESSLMLMTIAYNFMSLFKKFIINDKIRNRLSTIRYKILAIPAYFENQPDKQILKMAVDMNSRAWIRKLFDNSRNFNFT